MERVIALTRLVATTSKTILVKYKSIGSSQTFVVRNILTLIIEVAHLIVEAEKSI